jgi:hypothetical protein
MIHGANMVIWLDGVSEAHTHKKSVYPVYWAEYLMF